TVMTAEAMAQDVCGNWVEEAKVVTAEAGLFKNAASGDYTLNLDHGTVNTALKDKGDSALGGFYDLLWHATDFAGRPRILGTDIDIGPYEIADTVTVTCTVIGAGEVSASATTVQEGDTVTFTASKIENYERDFLGFYVNGELRTTEMTFSLAITKSDVIEARFQGLSATTENFTAQIAALHPTLREELLLADGAYTLNAETIPDSKLITFKGTTLGGTTLSISGGLKDAILVNATVTCTAAVSNVTLHRCLVGGLSGTDNITVTSSILKTKPSSLTATMANVTVYGSGNLPVTITATNCLVLGTDTSAENFDWVGQAILQKGSDSIDAGAAVSLTPYDNLDIAGRPRKMGSAIDLGAHECFYVAMSVTAEGEYTTLTPEPGEHDYLAGDTLALDYTSSRAFLGWTLNGEALGTKVTSLVIPEESTQALTATFQGFTLASGDAFPTGATAKDTITLGPGTYAWSDISTEAKIVGTGTQSKVTINGSVTGGRFEAVTLNATLTNATLNRCLMTGGTLTNCTVANSVIEAATLSGGTYVNNTVLSGITLPTDAFNTRTVSAVQEDYTPAVTETTVVDSGSDLNDYQKTLVGDLDYYGKPRINNVRIDLGAAEYVWPPYTVTLAVVGHGLVEPRGTVEVVRGQSLTFTAKADPQHNRGTPVVKVGSETLSESESHYTYTPTADNTIITVTFPGLTVGASETYKTLSAAIAEAQDGETITVQAGTYRERVDVKTKKLRIVAAEADATQTIIDANHEGRAVALNENSEIVGFTIINGAASEGAGVRGGTVRRCIIRDNTLTYNGFGGGIYGAFAESCLIYNNGSSTQRSSGGGASNSELLNCTVAANAAEKGGGLYDCTAKNCVIALNTDLTGTASDWAGDSVDPQPDDCCTPTSGGITVDANAIFVRPEVADFRLREGIACLNVAAADERLSALDVFGTQRPYGTGIDMGAIEWNAPDYVITLSFNSRSQATMVVNEGDNTEKTYTCAWDGTLAARTFTVPRFKADGTTRTSIKLTWTKATGSATDRTLSGILLDGATLSGSSAAANAAGFTWQVSSENTVNVNLTFQAESLTVAPKGNLSQALTDATPGETIKLQDGDYNLAISVGAGVTLEGTGSSSLLQGATLADGAILKGVTVTGAPVVGPETGSATLLHSIVTGVTDGAGAVKQNVLVKSSLIHNNAAGLGANVTAYLSTVADTDGTALAATAKAYGCAIWRYSLLAETGAEMVDCWAGIEPGFLAPAPEGEDYHLSAHSELIDAAGTAQWPGFTEADRALTDLAGKPRNTLQGYDCGAYEYQGTATVTDWTWFGSAASMDGDLAGAGWRQMTLGSAHALPANVAAVWADRNGYPEANVRADAPLTLSALTIKTVNTCFALLQGAEAGRVTVTGTLMKSAASSLVLAGPLTVQGGTTLSAGTVTLAEGADIKAANVTLNGSTTFRQMGGNFTFGNFFYARDTVTFSLEGGTFKGGELSVAKGSNQTALVFAGADVTLTRIETGDEAGARYGDIIQTGGTVTLTGSGSGKSAPLHISHWPGSSTYSLQGGTLCVPNGEVRLGQDGTGTLRLEGGVAKIRSIGRSNGSVVLAGGTFHALETQALNNVQYVSGTESRLEVADGETTLTFYGTTDSSNTGGLTLGP
ncbi:MAG: right-handed parallel beta-helix repeat-containing protein, partial [Lentisphaeraceae bacterium]|nr:right-handed parallel beta-helix repeat-containing protein [Lentisphaeraceae bacterium]